MDRLTTATGTREISPETPGLHAKRVAFRSIPIIDFNDVFSGDTRALKTIAEKIRKASIEIGFFYIKNHGIPQTLIEQVFAVSKRFFTLPLEQKMELHVSRFEQHAGYIPVGGEKLDDYSERGHPDQKESLEVSIGLQVNDANKKDGDLFLPGTLWLRTHPEIREVLHTYYKQMWGLSRLLYRITALALGLPEEFFTDSFSRPITNIRLLSYPPVDINTKINNKIRACGEHSDYLGYNLLVQDQVGGLEVLNSNGEWIEATPVPGTFVVNTGDLISHWTNDLFASTVHRVTVNKSGQYRNAVAFFTGPNFDASIECLPSCTDDKHPPKYPPTTTGEYLFQRLSSTVEYTRA